MKQNISGLHGRNITFLKGVRYENAYIIKYTDRGEYYALSKSNGKLYKFSGGTLAGASYHELLQYGISISHENWQDYVDFDYVNPCKGKPDNLELCKSIAGAVCAVSLIICAIFSIVTIKPLPYMIYGAFILSGIITVLLSLAISAEYFRGDDARGKLSAYGTNDAIDYNNVHPSTRKTIRSPNVYRLLLLISLAVLASTVTHISGGAYPTGCFIGAGITVIGFATLGLCLKFRLNIKGLKWCIMTILMISYIFATSGSAFSSKTLQILLAIIFSVIFIKENIKQ